MKSIEFRGKTSYSARDAIVKTLLFCLATGTAACTKETKQNDQPKEVASTLTAAPSVPLPKKTRMPTCPERKPNNPPIIGVSGNLKNPDYFDEEKRSWIAEAGGIAVRLNPDNFEAKKCNIDAIVLMGGKDIRPERYGGKSHPTINPLEEGRFEFDMRLLDLAETVRLPVLGICLGMQEMWVRAGGKLIPDISSMKGEQLNHQRPHDVGISPALHGSFLDRTFGKGFMSKLQSNHHQAIEPTSNRYNCFTETKQRVPENTFCTVGSAYEIIPSDPSAPDYHPGDIRSDDVIEAIETKLDERVQVGIQWHPRGKNAVQLYRSLVEEATKRD